MAARAKEQGQAAGRRSTVPTALALALLFVVAGVAFFGRATLVGAAHGLAALYARFGLPVNIVGLDFSDVHTVRDVADGAPGLVVEGIIANVTSRTVEVPPIRLVLLDGAGERVGGWQAEPAQLRLAPGESQKFRTRLASPPDPARKVSVSFGSPGTKG